VVCEAAGTCLKKKPLIILGALCSCAQGVFDPGGAPGPDAGPPPAEAQAWLDAHNAIRRNVSPQPATPLPPLTWSSSAAAVAQAWADGCTYQHNAGRGTRGENIAANTPPGTWSPATVVNLWASEASDYDYASNSCAAGKVCGHYTQLVWRDTLRVGCAHRICSVNSPFPQAQTSSWEFWVCDYEPPGNYVGQRPY
jgi:pathogenesis-related protein 1